MLHVLRFFFLLLARQRPRGVARQDGLQRRSVLTCHDAWRFVNFFGLNPVRTYVVCMAGPQ